MKVWITKYALSSGIFAKDLTVDGTSAYTPRGHEFYHGEGRERHRTEHGAKAKADSMRLAKIASLKKQIAKLEALRFG